jgi:hypothetical protein
LGVLQRHAKIADIDAVLLSHDHHGDNLDDIRRSLRLGMGPCQGGFCIYRATGILHGVGHLDGGEAAESLLGFLQERWKGVWPILYGDQLRQARLDDWIFQGLLGVLQFAVGLAMVAGYHGQGSNLAELRRRFGLSLKGATLQDLVRIADRLGLASRPVRLELDELRASRRSRLRRRSRRRRATCGSARSAAAPTR